MTATTTFKSSLGRKVVSASSAEVLGELSRLVVDVNERRVTTLVIGKGRKALLVKWESVTGFGPDAVMVTNDDAAHVPADDQERAATQGALDLLARRALTELGNQIGEVDDVEFDPSTGGLQNLVVGSEKYPATTLLGVGPYAAVLDKTTNPE
jgi:sporulation protein YlmC with PRC-barrel domain